VNSGSTAITVPAAAGALRFWRNTSIASLPPGGVETLAADTVGYEWDEDIDNGVRPPGLIRLSDTTLSGVEYLQDWGSTYASGTANHALTLYRHASGALVFGAGTVQWSWGLDSEHDRGSGAPSVEMQQSTVNLFADMGVQPLTLQPGLVRASASSDTLAPTSAISSPANGGTVASNVTVLVSGTAGDAGGGQVAAVEISLDGGASWRRANGGGIWSYTWQTGAPRTVSLVSRAVDDSGNLEQPVAVTLVTVAPDTTAPVVSGVTPTDGQVNVAPNTTVASTFNEPMAASSMTASTFELRDPGNILLPAAVTYAAATQTAILRPDTPLAYSTTYTARVKGGSGGVTDASGNPLAADVAWSFTTADPPAPPPTTGPGGPILVIASAPNPFTQYYAEILRAEGLNAFNVMDITAVSSSTLASYDVAILGDMALTSAQVAMLSDWVTAGGNLIAMRPDKKLASLLGLADAAATLSDAYLLVDTSAAPGTGIAGQTMQFHGNADRYAVAGATAVASLYSTANTATPNPAVTLRGVGAAGGQAAAFTYDLARSIVYTRQGNPAWSGEERDGSAPIRPDDLFFGSGGPTYLDLDKVAIPQADEQQRLLANLIALVTSDRKPVPRFWYFPRGAKAVVVMTGDDHGNNGTAGRFDAFNATSAPGCSVADWECVRGTSYIYPDTPISAAQVAGYVAQGFEIGVHMWMSGDEEGSDSPTSACNNFTAASIAADYGKQLSRIASLFPSTTPIRTNRTHCIVWSDYTTQPLVAGTNGIRFDTNYYYWPPNWVNNTPGVFTGSAMPMRFAKADGTTIDVYQAATQMTDESGQSYPFTIDTLLNRALGAEGYYGAFVANMHTDTAAHAGSEAIVASAQARGVPIVSASQMLDWIDGRNSSTFGTIAWNGSTLGFTVGQASGARNLQTLLPAAFGNRRLTSVTRDGSLVPLTFDVIKGIEYAAFSSPGGNYVAAYDPDTTPPAIVDVSVTPGMSSASITWNTNEAGSSRVDFGITPDALTSSVTIAGLATAHSVTVTGLAARTSYYFRITSADINGNPATEPAPPNAPGTFTTNALNCPCTIWPTTAVPGQVTFVDTNPVELGVKFQSSFNGFITAVRFYKGPQNTGPHTGNIWSADGTLLGTVTFSNESAEGWQQAFLPAPVAVTAGTTYVASYHTTTGFYSADGSYFLASGVTSGPLTAPASEQAAGNGVYVYGATAFPTQTFNGTNYWVDVVFNTIGDITPPAVAGLDPPSGSSSVKVTARISATFSEMLNPASISGATFELRNPANQLVAGAVSYDGNDIRAALQPAPPLARGTTYTARLRGRTGGVRDLSGNPLAADVTWSFTTEPCAYVLSPPAADIGAAAASRSVGVTTSSDCGWDASSQAAWITITGGATASGSGNVSYGVAANPSSIPRVGTITLAGQTFTVTQAGVACTFSLSTSSANPSSAGGPGGFIVNAVPGCNWTATSNNGWITLTGNASGTGDGSVTFSVAPYTNSATRSGTISVGGRTFTVNQTGVACAFTLSAASQPVLYNGGTASFSVVATASDCAWNAVSTTGWIAVTGASGIGSRTVTFGVGQNPTTLARTGTIVAAGQTFTVLQSAAPSGPHMIVDTPTQGQPLNQPFTLAGWAIDSDSQSGPGVDAIHVYAYPNPGSGQPPIFLGVGTYGDARPDLANVFGSQFANSGFHLTAGSAAPLAPGAYQIVVFAHSTVALAFNQARVVDVTIPSPSPLILIDGPANGSTIPATFTISGWAIDLSSAVGPGVDTVHVWAFPTNGGPAIGVGVATYGIARPDVGAIFGARFTNSGWTLTGTLPSGRYTLAAYPHDTVSNTFMAPAMIAVTVR
jgi:uncharacterized protein DUF4082/Big-like domain-containing protein/N,N-dimethylformamidase beta subunit-like protein/purple acid phosphatase-like protein/all-beta uncharacterized protein/BACON domain-containing protein